MVLGCFGRTLPANITKTKKNSEITEIAGRHGSLTMGEESSEMTSLVAVTQWKLWMMVDESLAEMNMDNFGFNLFKKHELRSYCKT